MKLSDSIKKLAILFVMAVALSPQLHAQQSENAEPSKDAILEKNIQEQKYVFDAQTALPLGGRAIQLTTPYELRVAGDTVVAQLPYFGRAFSPPVPTANGGIQFTSTDFEYDINESKKGWEVSIKPKDVREVRQLFLRISKSGQASLQVTSNNRQSISFNGNVQTSGIPE